MLQKGKVLFIDESHPILPNRLLELGFECDFRTDASRLELMDIVDEYDGIVVRSRIQLDRSFLEKAIKLKFIARYGVGLEHIDTQYAAERQIPVFNSPEGSKDTVAEHAIGMLLSLMHHISRADREIRSGKWRREMNRGTELMGKTVGILGYGNLGQAFAKRLTGFGVHVITYDKYRQHYGDSFAKEVSLAQFFASTDILSIHIPYEAANHYFIDRAFIRSFHKSIYLINTARGLVLNTVELLESLREGEVVGAALDVLEYEEGSFAKLSIEELPGTFQELRRADNVLLTPHIAGWSHMSKRRHAEVLAGKVQQLVQSGGVSLVY